jgi:hypothetical protein
MFRCKTRLYFVLIIALTAFWTVKSTFRDSNWQYNILTSDGRGYYAFLPAFFVFQEDEYEDVKNAELAKFEHWGNQNYIYITAEGRRYNKCFPGVAVTQTPSFLLGLLISNFAGQETTGYSDVSLIFLLVNGWLFALLGLWLMYCNMRYFTEDEVALKIAHFSITFATFLFFGLTAAPSFSHVYSFAFLNLFVFIFLRIQTSENWKLFLFLGFILGMIFIIRPSNVLVVFFTFFLLGSRQAFFQFIQSLFANRGQKFWLGFVGFALVLFVLPLLWYWQTEHWVLWSYDGEGFYFSRPEIFKVLFSYHIGLLVHVPLLIIACLFALAYFKIDLWKGISWWAYFALTVYIISSWWSYDYASSIGNRAFFEHLFIFAFPLMKGVSIVREQKRKLFFFLIILLAVFHLYTAIRVYQHISGIFPVQRFTKTTYWKSMLDLEKAGLVRYFWLYDILPFAQSYERTNLSLYESDFVFDADREFGELVNFGFPDTTLGNRYSLEISFDKKLLKDSDWTDILLVADGVNQKNQERTYIATPIYNFFREGKDEWHATTIVLSLSYDQNPVSSMKLYFWNTASKSFEIRDVMVVLVKAVR